jgi:hypothetical protein
MRQLTNPKMICISFRFLGPEFKICQYKFYNVGFYFTDPERESRTTTSALPARNTGKF